MVNLTSYEKRISVQDIGRFAQDQKKTIPPGKQRRTSKPSRSTALPSSQLHFLHAMKKLQRVFRVGCIILGIATAPKLQASPPGLSEEAKQGQSLFERNCAHCHGDDARGDEGPDLHDLKKSDARITKIVAQGIKGEMPAFGTKLNDEDVKALIAFLRTLKN
jgi:mono/diheme cytochrome c family protein